jgi:signal transduction histidine kinase
MHSLSLRLKALLLASTFALVIVGCAIYFHAMLQRSTDEVIASNRIMTEAAVAEINNAARPLMDSLWHSTFLQQTSWTREEEKRADALLSAITVRELALFQGTEGGFYFVDADQFLGYAFPTSPPPQPAFGPPPRSFNIIREQVRQSIAQRQRILQMHQFDPATFPLVTEPIGVRGHVVGAVWARVHIERLLPTVRLTSVLIVAAIVSLIGFVVVILIAWRLRKRTEEIRIGLETLRRDTMFRFPKRRGVFGVIMLAINDMVAARTGDQHLRERLERELHQQDKMASLGKLIARVAHEVKTPLAVIKTRIQMWQRKLRKPGTSDKRSVISEDAMTVVVGEIDRLSELVKRLLTFSKPTVTIPIPSDVHHVLRQTLTVVEPVARARRVRVHTAFAPETPLLPLDPQAMEQVFLNICTNALDAMPGGGHLQVATVFEAERQQVIVSIEDDGTGISPEALPRIFDPFFSTKAHGAGLGLSISCEIIRTHGGRIEFLPRNGRGTICRIHIPTARPAISSTA